MTNHLASLADDAGSKAAGAARAFMKPMIFEADHLLQHDRSFAHAYQLVLRDSQNELGKSAGKLQPVFVKLEKVITESNIRRTILEHGKIVEEYKFSTILTGIGAAGAAWKAYDETKGLSQRGRIAHAVMVGATDAVFSPLGVVDLGIKGATKMLNVDEKVADSISISKWAEGTANQFFSIGRAIWSGDCQPVNELHRQNMTGQNGRILQGYAMLGEKLADTGVLDPAFADGVEVYNHVHSGITKSLAWWKSH